jgi:hypothetical protein
VQLQLAHVLIAEAIEIAFSHLAFLDSHATQPAAASESNPPTIVMITRSVRTTGSLMV